MKTTKDNSTLKPGELEAARELESLLRLVLVYDKVLSVSTLCVFTHIAAHEGCSAADLCKVLELAQPAVVRHLQRLSTGSQNSRNVGRGLGLVRHEDDPKDTRRRLYFLTELGVYFAQQLATYMPQRYSSMKLPAGR